MIAVRAATRVPATVRALRVAVAARVATVVPVMALPLQPPHRLVMARRPPP